VEFPLLLNHRHPRLHPNSPILEDLLVDQLVSYALSTPFGVDNNRPIMW
jgi:hypothetical protein